MVVVASYPDSRAFGPARDAPWGRCRHCGNEPRSAASLGERIDGAIVNFRQRLTVLAAWFVIIGRVDPHFAPKD